MASSASPVTLLGALVAWGGYTTIWYGGLMLRGYSGPGRPDGIGVMDLILPSRVAKVVGLLGTGAPSASSGIAPGSAPLAGGNGTIGPTNPQTNIGTNANGQIIATSPAAGQGSTSGAGALGTIFNPFVPSAGGGGQRSNL